MNGVAATPPPASRGSVWAVALAVMAALGPVLMVVMFVAFNAPSSSGVGLGVLGVVLTFVYEVTVGAIARVISIVLALAVRRRGGASRRNSTIALTILGVAVSLVVLQVLLYLPR